MRFGHSVAHAPSVACVPSPAARPAQRSGWGRTPIGDAAPRRVCSVHVRGVRRRGRYNEIVEVATVVQDALGFVVMPLRLRLEYT